MDKIQEARALRGDPQVHYNCCQSVLIPFAGDCGVSREKAERLGAHFGGGMRMGSTCGAVTGALMVLGMAGRGEADAKSLVSAFKTKNGALDCAALLRRAGEAGEERKCHCDRMVEDAVTLLEQILAEE